MRVGEAKASNKKQEFILFDPKPSDLFMIRFYWIEPVFVEENWDEL